MALYELVQDGEPVERVNTEDGSNEDVRLAEAARKSRRRKDGWRVVEPQPTDTEGQGQDDGGG